MTDLAVSVIAVRHVSLRAPTIDDGLVFARYLDKVPAGGYYFQARRPMRNLADKASVLHD